MTVFVGAVTVIVFVMVSVCTTVRVLMRVCSTVSVRTWVTVRTSVIVFVPPHEASAAATAAATGTRKGGLGFTAMTLDGPVNDPKCLVLLRSIPSRGVHVSALAGRGVDAPAGSRGW